MRVCAVTPWFFQGLQGLQQRPELPLVWCMKSGSSAYQTCVCDYQTDSCKVLALVVSTTPGTGQAAPDKLRMVAG